MIGNLTPTLHKNSEDTTAFMRPYCSLCSSLRKQHGLPSSLLLNYELSFILLSLDPYIESTPIQTRCPSSAFTKMRPAYSHPAADLAANLSLVLGWLKTIDHIADTHQKISFSFLVKGLEKKLGKKVARIMENFSPETRQAILDYILVSKNSTEEIGNVRSKTFILSRQVALEIISTTTLPQADQQTYANFFGHLGASIALLDPLLDLEKDLEKKAYNPIIEKYEQEGQELSRHYLTFLHQYKEEHGKLKQQLTQQHLFPLSFIRVMTSGLDQNFKKIRKVTDRLFGHLEETLLDGMIGCNTTCQRCATHQKTKPTALAGLFLPFNGCGGGGSGCGGGNNCGSGCHGCGNSCNGCGNSCNGCGNACNGCGNSCNGCGESCNAC